jgi:hypothetical protein
MPSVFPEIKDLFETYARENFDAPKAEFYIPKVMSYLIDSEKGNCKVFESTSDWFGVTYPEDKEMVKNQLNRLIADGKYPNKLW